VSSEWRSKGFCYGDDYFDDVDMLPSHEPAKSFTAQSMCKGCPVFKECAIETIRLRDVGVVKAGKALGYGNKALSQYNELRVELGLPTVRVSDKFNPDLWPRDCRHCDRSMRPKGQQELLWPNTIEARSHDLCMECHNRAEKSA
jgi:hypothetical protein